MKKKKKKQVPQNRGFWDESVINQREEQSEIAKELTAVTITQKFRDFKIREIIVTKEIPE